VAEKEKWNDPDVWEAHCPRCDMGNERPPMEKGAAGSGGRAILKCTNPNCLHNAYADASTIRWKKRPIDFFAINKLFSSG
jgi:hypothetical protein